VKWNRKIKAGALQFVLLIGTVIALLLMTFAMLSHTQSFFGKKTELFIQTVKHADLGLEYLTQMNSSIMDSVIVEVPTDYPIEIKGVKEFWGVFEKYSVVATSKKNYIAKSILVGQQSQDALPALYLQNKERPLIMVGDSRIVGKAVLPQQGIRTGNIGGNSFYGNFPNPATFGLSNSQLPAIHSEIRLQMENLLREGFNAQRESVVSMTPDLRLTNSFHKPTKYIYGEIINLTETSLTGNIVIRASRKIIVHKNSALQDVILIAPEIEIKNGVVGSFQAFSSKSIQVGKGCMLNYPTALVTIDKSNFVNKPNQVQPPAIFIDSRSDVRGLLVFLGAYEKLRFTPHIKIEDKATLWGELYNQGSLELEGTINGSVSTSSFVALQGGSIYQNHLYNGVINRLKLPKPYVGLLMNKNQIKNSCKWLY